MANPFPGMNPYLEHPALWSGIHHRLITAIANSLAPQIQPKYIVAIEERVYEIQGEQSLLVGVPDVAIQKTPVTASSLTSNTAVASPPPPLEVTIPLLEPLTEGYLEIRAVETGAVITAIEVLSPKNKQSTAGRMQYTAKRQAVFSSSTHFVEIDLLRSGEPMAILGCAVESHYRILVSRSETRPKAALYAFNVGDRIPTVPIPLQSDDIEPLLDLQSLLNEIYDQGGYGLRIDYQRAPESTAANLDLEWIDGVLRDRGLR
jgi:hypothetical protein